MSLEGLGCAKTKSDLVVMPSEGRIFTFFCSQRDHKPQNSGCSHTAQRFHTARVKTSKVQNEQMFSGVPPKSGLSVCAVLEAISSGGRPARCQWLVMAPPHDLLRPRRVRGRASFTGARRGGRVGRGRVVHETFQAANGPFCRASQVCSGHDADGGRRNPKRPRSSGATRGRP
jgi:hypothetical protein